MYIHTYLIKGSAHPNSRTVKHITCYGIRRIPVVLNSIVLVYTFIKSAGNDSVTKYSSFGWVLF